ncbi:MAG TPA: hypothetical protein EYG03_17790 [Planctomycetes bacterium]|nr:hypothetical protein [Fuerstiella sp.]HIK93803.1 hypothetical protein [Planctomycetota bacterium]
MFSFRSSCIAALLILLASQVPAAGQLEAVQGKRYRLTSQHGPWMIMVAALRDVPEERRIDGGLSAWEAADRLVYELRRRGIPAYTFLQSMEVGKLDEYSSGASRESARKYISRHEAIAVLAGNFRSPDQTDRNNNAKAMLSFVKKEFQPSFLKEKKYGGIFAVTPGRPSPLSRAHMTVNPLRSASGVKRNTVDSLVRKLNSSMEHSLLKNQGQYTLRVATFRGKSQIIQTNQLTSENAKRNFNNIFGSNLDEMGTRAWELTEALRSASKSGYDQNFEAYVFHDRFESYVTIGSFDSPNDPRIAQYGKRFGGKYKEHQGREVLTAELFTIPRNVTPTRPAEKLWMFDTVPRLIEVPQVR